MRRKQFFRTNNNYIQTLEKYSPIVKHERKHNAQEMYEGIRVRPNFSVKAVRLG